MSRQDAGTIRRLTRDRRMVLGFLLETFKYNVPGDAVLDALDVKQLLEALKRNEPIDFQALTDTSTLVRHYGAIGHTDTEGGRGPSRSPSPPLPTTHTASTPSLQSPLPPKPVAKHQQASAVQQQPPLSKEQETQHKASPQTEFAPVPSGILSRPASGSGTVVTAAPANNNSSAEASTASTAADTTSEPPQSQLESGLSQDQQSLLAYTLAYTCCHARIHTGKYPFAQRLLQQLSLDAAQAAAVRQQLDHLVSEHVQGLANGQCNDPPTLGASSTLLLVLLERMTPDDFGGQLRPFWGWQGAVVAVLAACCRLAVAGSWQAAAAGSLSEADVLAMLDVSVQVLDQLCSDEWSQQEHAAAIASFKQKVQMVASNSSARHTFPRQLQLQVAALLEGAAAALGHDAPAAQQLLQECLYQRPAPLQPLSLTPLQVACCQALGALRQYQATHNSALLQATGGRLAKVAKLLARDGSSCSAADRALAHEVAAAVQALVQEQLQVQLSCSSQQQQRQQQRKEPLPLLVELQQWCARVSGRQSESSEVLPALVKTCVHSSWAQDVQQLQDSGASVGDMLGLLGQNLVPRLSEQAAAARQVEGLAPSMPDLAAVAALEYYKLYGELLAAWADELLAQQGRKDAKGTARLLPHDKEALKIIRDSAQLESKLASVISQCSIKGPELVAQRWRIPQLIEPVLTYVVTFRNQVLQESLQRLVGSEAMMYRPASSTVGYSQAALEVERLVGASLEVLLQLQEDLGFPLPWSLIATHLQNVEQLLLDFAKAVMDILRQASCEDELLPRAVPQQLLYSAAQSSALAVKELGPGAAGHVLQLLGPAGQLAEGALASVPARKAGAAKIEALTTERLCVLMESVWHLHRLCSNEEMAGQQQLLQSTRAQRTFVQQLRSDWFADGGRQHSESGRSKGQNLLDNALEVARDKLYEAVQHVAAFLASKVVLWEQRALWLELLYRHAVPGQPGQLQLPLAALLLRQREGPWQLPSSCATIEDTMLVLVKALRSRELKVEVVPHALLRAVCTAVERVLLEGGPARAFAAEFAGTLGAEVALLQDVFVSIGRSQARVAELVAQEVAGLRKIHGYMALPSAQLLQQLDAARAAGQQSDHELLFKVAVHRADEGLAQQLGSRYKASSYFDVQRKAVHDVISRLPGWFTSAGWSKRR